MRPVDNGDDADIMEPRPAYHRLQALWQPQGIPATSAWGTVVMLLLLLSAGSVVLRRRDPFVVEGAVSCGKSG